MSTFDVLKDIANSIQEKIQFTYDVPSNHDDGRMPVLDLKVSIDDKGKVKHKFYKKPMSHPHTIMNRSAMSMAVKRSTIFMEMMRRIKNNSSNDDWNIISEDLLFYMNSLCM